MMRVLQGLVAAAVGGLAVCAVGVSPASAGTPADVTVTEQESAGFIPCGTTMLSFTGTERVVARTGQSASGNQALTFVVTSNGTVTDEAGNVYRIHGVQTLPLTIQVQDGVETYRATFNNKFVILDLDGGLVTKFNATATYSYRIVGGVFTELRYHSTDQGTCSL